MIKKTLFWLHLIAGLAAGALIAVMSFTGAALAFEKDLITWAERDARRIDAPAGGVRLSLEEILTRARAAQPELRVNGISVSADPKEAITLSAPNNRSFCVNPYTGEVREALAPGMRAFLQSMRNWHTRLNIAGSPGNPSLGAQLNSAANFIFVFLGLSGLVLWWPSAWNTRVLRPSLWFNRGARGRARDWNWHNVIGFWSLPLLLLLAGTGVVLSYRWAGDLVFTLAGEKPPAPGAAPAGPPAATKPAGPAPTSLTAPAVLSPDTLLAAAQKQKPDWAMLTLRFAPALMSTPSNQPPPKTFTVVVKSQHPWPPFATDTLTLDAVSGEVKRADTFAALSAGTRARRWIRLLHSGEALGGFVQMLSALACLGGCVLVYTGFALAWRRFFSRAPAAAKNSP
jgi:uncharacterized iron-regulated membrane protein